MYNSSTGAPNTGSGGGANWNSWGLTNSGSAGSSEYCRFNICFSGDDALMQSMFRTMSHVIVADEMYSRQSGPGSASGPPGAMQQPTGPNTGNTKPPSDYASYGGYGE